MIRVSIINNEVKTHGAEFPTMEEAQAWVGKHEGKGTFGSGYSVVIEDITAQLEQEKANAEAQAFLDSTDYKVLKYRDQVDMGITPDLTTEEYQYLLTQRQQARDSIK